MAMARETRQTRVLAGCCRRSVAEQVAQVKKVMFEKEGYQPERMPQGAISNKAPEGIHCHRRMILIASGDTDR